MRWLIWMPLVAVVSLLSIHFFRLGWIAVNTTETEVINFYAQRYLEDRARDGNPEGAAKHDCVAFPGTDEGIWLHIVCGPAEEPSLQYEYEVDRWGQYVRGWSPHSQGVAPDTGLRRPET